MSLPSPPADDGTTVTPTKCTVCTKIVEAFAGAPGLNELPIRTSLGTGRSILETCCSHHIQYFTGDIWRFGDVPAFELVEVFVERYENCILFTCGSGDSDSKAPAEHSDEGIEAGEDNRDDSEGDDEEENDGDGEEEEEDDDVLESITCLMSLVSRKDRVNHPGKAHILDEQWIDESLLRSWIDTCCQDHNCGRSGILPGDNQTRPSYLIDVQDNCVVAGADVQGGYVALSYVWGQAKTLRNQRNILDKLRKPGTLSEDSVDSQIPTTVKDAIRLSQCLGQRYLWVDALCIVQDDTEHLQHELSQMPGIYAGAVFTIVAADGEDASHGLRGFRGFSQPRSITQNIIPLADSEQLVQVLSSMGPRGPNKNLQIPYHQRAWTFQEYQCAPRRLVFGAGTVRWICQESELWEDIPVPNPTQRQMDQTEGIIRLHSPIPGFYTPMIMEFNQRNLTFPEDALNAFMGIQTMLSRVFPKGFIYGMPVCFMELALLWVPKTNVTRRISTRKSQEGQNKTTLPSWSWLGYQGSIAMPYDCEFAAYNGGVSSESQGLTDPVTQWYSVASPSSTERQPLQADWHVYKKQYQDPDVSVPEGWERSVYQDTLLDDDSLLWLPRKVPQFCYELSIFAKAARQNSSMGRLLHWFAVPDPETLGDITPPVQHQYLCCLTSRAFFHPGSKTGDGSPPPQVLLQNRDGRAVGYLQLHNEEDLSQFSNANDLVELVAIANGYRERLGGIETEAIKHEGSDVDRSDRFEDCVFVLCVEWIDGIAYRRAAGAVLAAAWEEARCNDLVNLVLG